MSGGGSQGSGRRHSCSVSKASCPSSGGPSGLGRTHVPLTGARALLAAVSPTVIYTLEKRQLVKTSMRCWLRAATLEILSETKTCPLGPVHKEKQVSSLFCFRLGFDVALCPSHSQIWVQVAPATSNASPVCSLDVPVSVTMPVGPPAKVYQCAHGPQILILVLPLSPWVSPTPFPTFYFLPSSQQSWDRCSGGQSSPL